jgi:glycosyltransferase involved in cell wall biosynthesis
MPRILQVFRPRTGGTFGHVGVLSRELAAKGHDVAVCGPPGGGPDLGVPFIGAEIPREVELGGAAHGVREVGRAYRAFRPDLIHAHGAQAGVTARLARVARPGTPLIHTPHRYAFEDGRGRNGRSLAYEGIERALMPLATRVLCVCEAERRIAARIGAGDRGRVVHNGIDPVRPGPLGEPFAAFAAGGGPLIVAVSELFARKGVEDLLAAMPAVLREHPEARLIVAGEGPDRRSVEVARDRTGVGERVLLAGHVERVADLLGAADVFVNPALAEAFPYGVLEAMSAGCPCVVTNAGGTEEAVRDGESGVVVPTGDPAALGGAVANLLGDRRLAARLGSEARERVSTEFTRERMVAGTLAVYAELGIV